MPDPVLGVGELVARGHPGERRDHRDRGRRERQVPHNRAELVEHSVHVRRVERVADPQPLGPPAQRDQFGADPRHGVVVAGQHDRLRPVHRGDVHPRLVPDEQGAHLVLGRLHREHRAATGQRLHQPAPRDHQVGRVGQPQHARDVRGGHLADRVPGQ